LKVPGFPLGLTIVALSGMKSSGSRKSSMAFTNAKDDSRGLKVILKSVLLMFMKNSSTKGVFLAFWAVKFCKSQNPGIETLKRAVERLL